MRDESNLEASQALAALAMDSMRQRNIPAVPENFTVWYAHHKGDNPALSRTLRLIDEEGQAYTPERCRELFERYFGPQREGRVAREVGARMAEMVGRVGHDVKLASQHGSAYCQALAQLGGGLARKDPAMPAQVLDLVDKLYSRTAQMQERSQTLQAQLQSSGREIEALRGALASALEASITDQLTGLGNRRRFDDDLEAAVRRAARDAAALSLIILDIDHFKSFNDRHGHPMGDVVLRLVAGRLRELTVEGGAVARYGGEEFAIILPDHGLGAATDLAERICRHTANQRIRLRSDSRDLGRVTLSVGVAEHEHGDTPSTLLERADKALYRAKQEGRNRVMTDAGGSVAAPSTAA